MSEENLNVGILLNTQEAQQQLKDVDAGVKAANQNLVSVKEHARQTNIAVISVVRSSWGILRGVLKMAGVTVDAVTNAVVNALLMSGQAFYALASAQAKTPGLQAAAIITAIQAGVIIATAVQSEKEGVDIQREIESANLIIGNVNALVGMANF